MIRAMLLALFLSSCGTLLPAHAQHNHAQHHDTYRDWVNGNGRGCCNKQDCGELAEENERTTPGVGIEVRVEGQWCQIKPWHYLKKGNAPNWSTAHVCVQLPMSGDGEPDLRTPCERLLCYQPKPLF